MREANLWKISRDEVERLGIRNNCKGFYYLVCAAVIAVQVGFRKASLNKEIYDRIAEENEVSRESVEKCIRNCLEKAWMTGESDVIFMLGETGRKPTNSEAIAYISDRIRLESHLIF